MPDQEIRQIIKDKSQFPPPRNPDPEGVLATPVAPIPSAISSVMLSLGNLFITVNELERRLNRVLEADNPGLQKCQEPDEPRNLLGDLQVINELVCRANNRLHEMQERLQL